MIGENILMKRYTLYLDESQTSEANNGNPHFCMAGAIIKDDDYQFIEDKLNNFKNVIWSDIVNSENIVLHQMNIINATKGRLDITRYPEYKRFKNKNIRKRFYQELSKIYDYNKIYVVGGSVDEKLLNKYFNIKNPSLPDTYWNQTDKYLVTLQLLLENYCHFLCIHNGYGKIIYESRDLLSDERIRDRFYHIKLMGSMYITKDTMNKRLLGIDFLTKKDNNAGLQIADFIPNAFAREHAGFGQADKDDTYIRKLKYYRYSGNISNAQDRFGIKNMP